MFAVLALTVLAACNSGSEGPPETVSQPESPVETVTQLSSPTEVASPPALVELVGVRARIFHSATLLDDGTVLLAGGYDGESLIAEADIFDPISQTAATGPSLNVVRQSHTAVRLQSGEVLIAGGVARSAALASAELFDPAQSAFRIVGDLAFKRIVPKSVLLQDGRVLIAGGVGFDRPLVAEFEVYDPARSEFQVAGALPEALFSLNSLVLLADGNVLAVGSAAAAIIRPDQDWQVELVDASGPEWPSGSVAVLIDDFEVLLVGNSRPSVRAQGQLFVYNAETNTLTSAGFLAASRGGPALTLMADGRVLIAGGIEVYEEPSPRSSAIEIYSPKSGQLGEIAELPVPIARPTATLLADGSVLFIGIGSYGGAGGVTAIYRPPTKE